MLLPTADESDDGETWDIAGPAQTASSNLDGDRVWLANGRKRLPLRASDRVRMEAEAREFTAFGGQTDLRFERPIAVEYGQTRKRLYTLTEDIVDGAPQTHRWCLYAEDVSVPSNPVLLAVRRFVDVCPYPVGLDCDHPNSKHWPPFDLIQDIKLWEGTGSEPDLIVARTRKRLVTIQLVNVTGGTFALHVRGQAKELFQEGRGPEASWTTSSPWFKDSANFIQQYKIAFLIDFAVEQDQNGRLMAYALAEAGAYGTSRPLAQMVIACDLDKAGGYEHPTFDADPGPCVRYVVFNPLEDIGTPGFLLDAEVKEAHSAYHIDAYQAPLGTGTGTFLYVACGSAKQVQRVNVTNLFPQYGSTSDCGPSIILPPNTSQAVKLTVSPSQNIRHIMADPDAPGTRFVALAQEGTHIWDSGSVVASSTAEPNSLGPNRDSFIMKVPTGVEGIFAKHAWLALSNQVDHIGKVFNVTNGVSPVQLLPTRGQYFGINTSDGAVAIGNHVYLPNFSGVARYELIGGQFLYAQDSYKPCEVPPNSGLVGLTEHIDRGLQLPLPLGGAVDQIYTAPAIGAEYMFRIDSNSRDPLNAEWISPSNDIVNPVVSAAGGLWTYNCQIPNCGNPGVYGNDNVYVDISEYAPGFTNRYLINDMTKDDATPGIGSQFKHQIVLNVFWWNAGFSTTGQWEHKASVASPPILNAAGLPVGGQSITFAKHPSGKLAAFVAHSQGVMVFEMEGLKANDDLSIGALAYKQNIETTSGVSGLAVVEDRVFFVENGVNADNAQMKGYTWNPDNSINVVNNVWTMALLDALPIGATPRHPGQARRARVRNLPGSTGGYPNRHIYFAQDPYLIQWKWPKVVNGTADPFELDLTGYWRSDYDFFMQDCRIHDFPGLSKPQGMTYVLVAREFEAFALVGPID